MTFNVFSHLRNLLFVYQQEYYNTQKLLAFAYSKRIFEQAEKRQKLEWTIKTKPYYILTLSLFFICLIGGVLQFWWYDNLFFFLIKSVGLYFVLLAVLPFFLIATHVFLLPLDAYLKKQRIERAKAYYKEHRSHLKVIGITGSFGKTSVKELLKAVLSQKYSVCISEDNKNTPLGFAEWIYQVNYSHEILIVEMGAYYKGDIQEMCELTDPEYGVLTGINEQHLERMGSIETIIQTKNELSAYIPKNGKLWVNGRNERAKDSAPKYATCSVEFYDDSGIQDISYSGIGEQDITLKSGTQIHAKILAEYFPSYVDLAFKVGKELDLTEQEIVKALESLTPPEHRLSPRYYPETDILIIDDAFNGNPDGALSAMKTLARFSGKHRIYLTPGLVELADETERIHEQLGKNLAFNTDEVWLIRKSVTDFIIHGLKKAGFEESKIRIFEKDTEAHSACRNLEPGTVLLIQNDWTDNYI